MHHRGKTSLHASAVQHKGEVYIFSGKSHSGKSTLSNYFHNRGAQLISDDICVFDKLDEELVLHKSFAYQKLSTKYLDYFKYSPNNETLIKDRDRVGITIDENISDFTIPKKCIFINWGDRNKIKKIGNPQIIENLMKFMYLSYDDFEYEKLFELMKKLEFYEMNMVKDFNNLDQIYSLIINNTS